MKITLYIYGNEISWAQLEVCGVNHLTADCRTFGYHKTESTIELCTSNTTSKDAARDIIMFERDVRDGFARKIELDVEPIEKEWKTWGINSTVINFDYSLLNDPLPQE